MNALMKALGRYGAARDIEIPAEASEDHDFFVANGRSAIYTEVTRQGGVWSCTSAAGTPLVVIPTTLCIFEIYNNYGVGVVMEILDLYLFHLLGTAALHNLSLWAEVTAPKAAPTLSAVVVGSHSGKPPYTSTAGTGVVTGAATTVVSAGWRPYGMPGPGVVSTALPGEAWSTPVDGKLLVPPGCSLAITCVDALATASSVQLGATWNAKSLSLAGG